MRLLDNLLSNRWKRTKGRNGIFTCGKVSSLTPTCERPLSAERGRCVFFKCVVSDLRHSPQSNPVGRFFFPNRTDTFLESCDVAENSHSFKNKNTRLINIFNDRLSVLK